MKTKMLIGALADHLRKFVRYDPQTGSFAWRVGRSGSRGIVPGTVAGTVNKRGYVTIQVDGAKYAAHRLAWLLLYGEWPPHGIDHINGDRSDNRKENLRSATQPENLQNIRKAHDDSSTGFLGVSFDKRDGRYSARIMTRGTVKHIGMFSTAESAGAAYLQEKAKLHPFQTIVEVTQ